MTNGLLWAGELALKHSLPVELVVVEWNPPPDTPRLLDALSWPEALLDVLIVTLNSETKTRNPKPEVRNSKPEI